MRKTLASLLITSTIFIGCKSNTYKEKNLQKEYPSQINLEYLCDTPIEKRDLQLEIYIEPSEQINDIQEGREKIANYLIEFFSRHSINCKISYTNSPIKPKSHPDQIGIEIYDSKRDVADRYLELCPEEGPNSKGRLISAFAFAFAGTEKRIILTRTDWQTFRYELNKKDKKDYLNIKIEDETVGDLILRTTAQTLSHEIGHCLGLPHIEVISPTPFKMKNGEKNIMTEGDLPLEKLEDNPLGADFNELQVKIIHSFLAENNVWIEFNKNNRRINPMWKSIAEKTNLEYRELSTKEIIEVLKQMVKN